MIGMISATLDIPTNSGLFTKISTEWWKVWQPCASFVEPVKHVESGCGRHRISVNFALAVAILLPECGA